MRIFAYLGEGGNRIVKRFRTLLGFPDVITHANLGDDRFRGFWGSGGQISRFSIDLHCRPYNTLALPCQRVITGSTVVLTCCKGDYQSQWKTPIFSPLQLGNPLTDFDKIWNRWLRQRPDPSCQNWFLYV